MKQRVFEVDSDPVDRAHKEISQRMFDDVVELVFRKINSGLVGAFLEIGSCLRGSLSNACYRRETDAIL